MNNLVPLLASSSAAGFAFRLSLLLSLIAALGLLFWKLTNFISLFWVDVVAPPALPLGG